MTNEKDKEIIVLCHIENWIASIMIAYSIMELKFIILLYIVPMYIIISIFGIIIINYKGENSNGTKESWKNNRK